MIPVGAFDVMPDHAADASAIGVSYAVQVGDGVYRLAPGPARIMDYPWDEPELKMTSWRFRTLVARYRQANKRPVYTTLWGGSLGLGFVLWRNCCDLVGAECYGDWRKVWPWVVNLIKLSIMALSFLGSPWALVVNAYHPVDTKGNTLTIGHGLDPMPVWSLRVWRTLAMYAGARVVFFMDYPNGPTLAEALRA
jgi:hypothetical protein